MARVKRLTLAAACAATVVTAAATAQQPAPTQNPARRSRARPGPRTRTGGDASRRTRPRAHAVDVRVVPFAERHHRQRRLRSAGLARSHRHDDAAARGAGQVGQPSISPPTSRPSPNGARRWCQATPRSRSRNGSRRRSGSVCAIRCSSPIRPSTGPACSRAWSASSIRRPARCGSTSCRGHHPAQHPQRPRRLHLVHRQRQRHGRPSRSAHRRHQGLSDAGCRRARSPHADLRSRRQPVVHAAELEHGRPPRPVDRRDQAAHRADRQRPALRNHPQFAGNAVGGLQRGGQAREHRPEDHGTEGVSDAVAGVARPPARRAQGRHDLLRRLARLPGPLRSEDRRVQGMAVAERGELPALCAGRRQRRRLVQRIRAAA